MALGRIIFTGDLLRVRSDYAFPATQYIKHIDNLFSSQVQAVTGIKPVQLLPQDTSIFDRNRFYKLCNGKDITPENWIAIVNGDYTDEAIHYFKECFKDSLLIFQEAGSLKNIAKKAGIPYIDMYISSLRFLEDIHFAFRSNIESVRNKLPHYAVSDTYATLCANRLKSYYLTRKTQPLKPNSLLFCGQTEQDLSLIQNNRFVNITDYEQHVRNIFSQYDNIYYKPHPYSKNRYNEAFLKGFENVERIGGDIYKLLCDDNLTGVCALSSGVLKEAPYFGKQTHIISHAFPDYYSGSGNVAEDAFITVSDAYFSLAFWRDILSGIREVTQEGTDITIKQKQNFLRETFNEWWGYTLGNPEAQIQRTVQYKTLRKMLAFPVPSKTLRRKIRGQSRYH